LLIPKRVFDPRIKVFSDDENVINVFLDRDNYAKMAFYHEETKLDLNDVTEIELWLSGVQYLNSFYKIFDYSSGNGNVFINFDYSMKLKVLKGRHKAKIILYTKNHLNGIVWANENIIFNIQ